MIFAAIIGNPGNLTMMPIVLALFVVVGIFAVAFGAMWILKRFDGRFAGSVGSVKGESHGILGKISFMLRGVTGLFVILVMLVFFGIYVILAMSGGSNGGSFQNSPDKPSHVASAMIS